jgi:hypothetical protein
MSDTADNTHEIERLRDENASLRAQLEGFDECLEAFSEAANLMLDGMSDFLASLADQRELQILAAAAVQPANARLLALIEMIGSKFPRPN